MAGITLERVVTAAEAREEALLVSPWISHFPRPGEVFTLVYRGEPLSVMIVESPCECREQPGAHVHHRIPFPGLPRGAKVVLTPRRDREWQLDIVRAEAASSTAAPGAPS